MEIEEAFAASHAETNKKLDADRARLLLERDYTTNLRKERQRSSEKLKKEREGQRDVASHSHTRWIKKLARNLATQKKEHNKENGKLQKKLDMMEVDINDERKFSQHM